MTDYSDYYVEVYRMLVGRRYDACSIHSYVLCKKKYVLSFMRNWTFLAQINTGITQKIPKLQYCGQKESGGIYSWMEKSVGAKYAFIGTFMWYASYIIWMVNVSSTIWVPLSNAIFGSDSGWDEEAGGEYSYSYILLDIDQTVEQL